MQELLGLFDAGAAGQAAGFVATAAVPEVRQQVLAELPSGRVVQWVLPPGTSAEMAQLHRPRVVMPRTDGVLALSGPGGQVLQDLYTRVPFMWRSGARGTIRNVSDHPVLLDVAEPN